MGNAAKSSDKKPPQKHLPEAKVGGTKANGEHFEAGEKLHLGAEDHAALVEMGVIDEDTYFHAEGEH